jgi:hypothetical protein
MTDGTMTLRTTHEHAATVAAAIAPDNTEEMETTERDGVIHTTIERSTTGGLRATATDYIANLQVADAVASHANQLQQTHQ